MTSSGRTNGMRGKQVFTTGEAAAICQISQQTVIRCFDAGRLKGFRVPGSRFRRIPREELIRFMKANQIPLDRLQDDKRRVLVVDDDPQIIELFTDVLSQDGRFRVKTASSGYDAGLLTEQFRPELILLDYMLPDVNGSLVCKAVRAKADLATTKIIIVSGLLNAEQTQALRAAGADAFIKKPFSVEQLIGCIEELLVMT